MHIISHIYDQDIPLSLVSAILGTNRKDYYNAYNKTYDQGIPLSLVLAILGTSRKRVL